MAGFPTTGYNCRLLEKHPKEVCHENVGLDRRPVPDGAGADPGVTGLRAAEKVDDAWLKQVAALPAEKQVEAVAKKLKELNPDFDGKVTPKIEKGVVTEFGF